MRALARAATAVENRRPEAEALLRELFPRTGRALVLGVTGSPGAGKSTLVDQLIASYRSAGRSVGVIAVDPTSPFTGGAILGDRVRMQRHHADPGVFIRSMATRGWLGGLARATAGLSELMDAAGRDVVIIETVGVGQDEVDVARVAGVTAVVLAPGMGDDVQAIKAGIMEIADLFVINKADHPGAAQLDRELHQLPPRRDGCVPPAVKTVASEGQGISELVDAIERCRAASADRARPVELWRTRLREMLRERVLDRVPAAAVDSAARQVAARERDPYSIVEDWLGGAARIDHLGIAVRSIDGALGFYQRQLGLTPGARERVDAELVDVVMMRTGESRIELLEASNPESTIAKFLAKRGPGLHHVALRLADFHGAIERLRAGGARLLNQPRQGAGGHTYVFIHPESTGGVLLELIEDKEHAS